MADNRNDIVYSAEDFERYYSGKMPEAEMHALEKAALEDPFLQDALDGYPLDKNFQENLTELKNRVARNSESKKAGSVWGGNTARMLRAAGIIAFIAGTTYFIFKQSQKDKDIIPSHVPTLAENKAEKAGTVPAVKDTSQTYIEPNLPLAKNESSPKSGTDSKQEKEIEPNSNIVSRGEPHKKEILNDTHSDLSKVAATTIRSEEATQGDLIASGKVVNTAGEPIANAVLEVEQKAVPTDSAGNFSVYLTQETRPSNVAAVGYEPQKMRLRAADSQVIVLNKPTQGNLSIRGQASAAADTSTNYFIQLQGLEPIQGWKQYQEYVQSNLKHVPMHSDTAEAEIFFKVNQAGAAIDIYANPDNLKCVPCNAEAIRLLKEGPLWKYNPDQKGILLIQFYK